ncbi:potassium transporter [Sesbania bispinosa]|nr:potassium transporter [Sesbania bispinosa]
MWISVSTKDGNHCELQTLASRAQVPRLVIKLDGHQLRDDQHHQRPMALALGVRML